MKIVAISGSLRATSLNTAVLQAASRLVPAGVKIEMFEGIGNLPFFNSDLDGDRLPGRSPNSEPSSEPPTGF
jgi:chromate reductase, NAD(P)H dehydrogenase (quinone)